MSCHLCVIIPPDVLPEALSHISLDRDQSTILLVAGTWDVKRPMIFEETTVESGKEYFVRHVEKLELVRSRNAADVLTADELLRKLLLGFTSRNLFHLVPHSPFNSQEVHLDKLDSL